MKNKFKVLGVIALLAVIGFSMVACDTGGGGGGGGGGYYTPPSITYYSVSFDVGEGSGSAPSSRTVESGTRITLPGKSNMTAPSGKEFAGWRNSGTNYDEGDSYYVYNNETFTARWTTVSGGGNTQPTSPPSTPSTPGSTKATAIELPGGNNNYYITSSGVLWFKVTVSSSSYHILNGNDKDSSSSYTGDVHYYLYNSNGSFLEDVDLGVYRYAGIWAPGTYYIEVRAYTAGSFSIVFT
jgi:hypothetical protein